MKQHPIKEFWAKSGWQTDGNNPEDAMSEGKLAIDAWNAAIKVAVAEIVDSAAKSINAETLAEIVTNVSFMRYVPK